LRKKCFDYHVIDDFIFLWGKIGVSQQTNCKHVNKEELKKITYSIADRKDTLWRRRGL